MGWPEIAGPIAPTKATWWLRRLVGPAHRLVWMGDTDLGDRVRCRAHLRKALLAGSTDPSQRVLIGLVNWWVAATSGDDVVGTAWQIEAPFAIAPALQSVIRDHSSPALVSFRRPWRFRAAVERLRGRLDPTKIPKLRKAPAPIIYGEARANATELLAAAERGDHRPPEGLRLMEEDREGLGRWASERRGTNSLLHGVKVWHALHKVLEELAELAHHVRQTWTSAAPPKSPLPSDWRATLEQILADDADIATGLLADLEESPGARPACFTPEWSLGELHGVSEAAPLAVRAPLLALAREALDASPAAVAPMWTEETDIELTELRADAVSLEARALARGLESAGEAARAAFEHIYDLETADAREYLALARDALVQAEEGDEAAEIESRVNERRAALVAAGVLGSEEETPPSHDQPDHLQQLRRWASRVDERWAALGADLERRRGAVVEQANGLPEGDASQAALKSAREAESALRDGALGRAVALLANAEQSIRVAREQLEPELRRLLERRDAATGLGPVEQEGFVALTAVIRARAAARMPYQKLVSDAESLLEQVDAGGNEGRVLGVVEADRRVRSLCWLDTGVPVDPSREPLRLPAGEDGAARGQLVMAEAPGATARALDEPTWRRIALLESLAEDAGVWTPGPASSIEQEVSALYGRDDAEQRVVGPFSPGDRPLRADDARDFVVEVDGEVFNETFMKIPFEAGRALLLDVPALDELIEHLDAEARDPLGGNELEIWLAELLADMEGVRPDAVAARGTELAQQGLPPELLQARIAKLSQLVEVSRWLAVERERAAQRFLETEEGKRLKERMAQRYVVEHKADYERQIEAEKEQLAAEVAALEASRDALQGEVQAEQGRIAEATMTAQEQLDELESLRGSALLEIVGQLGGARPGPGQAMAAAPLTATPVACRGVTRLTDLGDALCRAIPSADDQLLRSVLAQLLTSPWVLFAGPPGGGKSSLARDLANALGAGPADDRRLELVVRREWQDDAALFGFWHPQAQAWSPSSDGLVEFLLAADHAWRSGNDALRLSILEELNLASPEYYLSRLISALEDDEPVVRLYGAQQRPANHERYPAQCPVNPNVRLLGTVNVDETVERLSPRFLSRAAVVWLEPEPEAIFGASRVPAELGAPLSWRTALALSEARVEEAAAAVEPLRWLVRFLHERRVPGAPTQRTLRALRRFLGVATDLLPPSVAQDFAVAQRILPNLRGVGPGARETFATLQQRLEAAGWPRSAERVAHIHERGEALGDYFDFFHA